MEFYDSTVTQEERNMVLWIRADLKQSLLGPWIAP